jgi:hypothetical protein
MPILRDWKCEWGHVFESMEENPSCPEIVPGCGEDECPCKETCGGASHRLPVGTKSYKIKGDNSASITPKKHRGEEK